MKPSEESFTLESCSSGKGFLSLLALLFLLALLASSCGSNSSEDDASLSFSEGSPANTIPINLLDGSLPTDGSIVKVVVKFKEGSDVRLSSFDGLKMIGSEGPFKSLVDPATASKINRVVTADTSRVINISRVMAESEEDVEQWRRSWAERGVELKDWNLYYTFDMPDAGSAAEFVNEVKDDDSVEYAEVMPELYLTEVTSPDMSTEQLYLKAAAAGGLDIEEAWAFLDAKFPGKNIRGQDVTVIDEEYDWNFDHEMLPIDETAEYLLLPFWEGAPGKDVPSNINHGTAVVGIVTGQGDGEHGIRGIAPLASMRVISAIGGVGGGGIDPDAKGGPGSIFLIETQQKGVTTVSSGCSVGDGTSSPTVTGCLPLEANQFLYDGVKMTTDTGVIVIEAAGNGSVDLGNDALVAPKTGEFSNFNKPENDSGAVMVGASVSLQRHKATWTNCGSRVDVFAHGAGAVTAGYGDLYNPNNADAGTLAGANDPSLYTGLFGGTSAATAQIAGIAALIQSYARAIVNEAGFIGRTVYLDPLQIRSILRTGGSTAVYNQTPGDPNPNCNIGVQPSALEALQNTEVYLNDPGTVLKIAPLNQYVVSGIRYDMDDDKKAELISFSRDHKWYIDLSNDGFGEWNVILDVSNSLILSPSKDAMLFPVVADYNSDGRADLALYDSISGKWYIKYTTSHVIASPQGAAISWDKIIDYSTDPNWKAYSRPVPADYDSNRWVDTALQTPNGHLLIDYGGFTGAKVVDGHVEYIDKFGAFERDTQFLTDQLLQAPGWSWLPVVADTASVDSRRLLSKAPDGIAFAKNLVYVYPKSDGSLGVGSINKDFSSFGGNDSYFATGGFNSNVDTYGFGFKDTSGQWTYLGSGTGWSVDTFVSPSPQDFGDVLCRPIAADYDGDGKDDRAVQCGSTWKIAYSTNPGELVTYELGSATDPLPGYVYSGGFRYQDIIALFDYYKTELPCGDSNCSESSTIYDVNPPIGPYFAECVRYWATNASYCWNK